MEDIAQGDSGRLRSDSLTEYSSAFSSCRVRPLPLRSQHSYRAVFG
jgi:hypothetical protein